MTRNHPQLIANPDNFWATKIKNIDWLLSSPKFRQIVVGPNGNMDEIVTVDPRAFVFYKTWLSQKEDRDPMKKPRDLAQARAVYKLVQELLTQLSFDKIHVFPERMRDEDRNTMQPTASFRRGCSTRRAAAGSFAG